MSGLKILLYNKVQLEDGSQGIVRYMGMIMGKKGIFYGVDITKGDAKNDGTFKNIKYFDTKKGTRTGRFCKENKIVKCKKTTFSKYPFKLGDVVMCTKVKCKATVKYVGVPSWAKGGKVYYGLELTKKKGTCNGTTQGVQYFESKMNYGIYVPTTKVKKVGGKKKTLDSKDDDVKEAMRDYYNSKPKDEVPKSIKKSKSKKKVNKNKKKSGKKKKTPQTYNEPKDSLDANPMTELHKPTVSIDYMDEEKDGINLTEYQNKTDEIDYEMNEKQRRERNERMKQMEREERLLKQKEKEQKLKEKQEKQKEKEALIEQQNAEKQKELLKREKELKDKERLEKYAQAMKEKEEAEKLQNVEKEEIERKKRENELRKQQEMEARKAKEEQEKNQREEERKLAEKLRKEKEAKLKQEEQKSAQPAISSGGGGSIKDRMAMFQKQNNAVSSPKTTPSPKAATSPKTTSSPKTVSSPKTEQKQQYNGGVGAPVGADKAINFELQNAVGKPLKSVKMTKVDNYNGEIPLALHLLGQKLIKLDKFGTFKIFHPDEMQKQADKPEMQLANNIFVFFASLPDPLLSTVPQEILMKAINKDVMKDVVSEMDEPYASTLTYLWDILAKVAMNPNARMGGQSLGKVFGPMCTMVTQADVKGNRVSMNALGASRMMAFFRRGIEWRMGVQGYDFEESDSD